MTNLADHAGCSRAANGTGWMAEIALLIADGKTSVSARGRTEMKREELEQKVKRLAESIEDDASSLNDLRFGIDVQYMLLVIDELRVGIGRLETYLEELESMSEIED